MAEPDQNRTHLTPHQKLALVWLTQKVLLLLLGLVVFGLTAGSVLGSRADLSVLAFLVLLFVVFFLWPVWKSIAKEWTTFRHGKP